VNLLDVLLIVIVAGSVATAFAEGFARAAIGFVAVVGGILCGFWFYGIPAEWLHHYISSNNTLVNILAFLIVFVGFQLAGGILGKILATFFRWTGLSFLDRIMGAGFGFVRGVLFAVAFVAVLMAFTPSSPPPNWMVNSTLLPYAIDASHVCAALAPRALTDAFGASMDEVRKAWDDQVKRAAERGKTGRDSKPDLKKRDQ
jgi:membrane protein required for colicin V production